jgi:hypothetical protein
MCVGKRKKQTCVKYVYKQKQKCFHIDNTKSISGGYYVNLRSNVLVLI